MKPRDVFVDDMSLYLRSQAPAPSDMLYHPISQQLLNPLNSSKGIIGVLWNFLTKYAAECIGSNQRNLARSEGLSLDDPSTAGSNEPTTNDASLAEEDGLFVPPKSAQPSSARRVSRVEERIRRELPNPNVIDSSCQQNNVQIITESSATLCQSPGHQHASYNRGGSHQQEIEVRIHVDKIKLSHHPNFTGEEAALCRITDLYHVYRSHAESGAFQYLVSRLLAIFHRVKTIINEMEEEGKVCSDAVTQSLQDTLKDLESTSHKLLKESDTIKELNLQIKQQWKVLLVCREETGFACTDAELTDTPSDTTLLDDVCKVLREISSLKATLSDISVLDQGDSPIATLDTLQDIEMALTNDLDHIYQTILIDEPGSLPQGWIPKEERIRRRRISLERYSVRLLLNGNVVGDTKVEKINWPSFTVRLDQHFHCKLYQQPREACVQILMTSAAFIPARMICSIYVGLPDMTPCTVNADSNTPVSSIPAIDWYQFASKGSSGLKGAVLLASSCKVANGLHPNQHSANASIPFQGMPMISQRKKLIRHSAVENRQDVIHNGVTHPDHQAMMAFQLQPGGTILHKCSLLEEPHRHDLIKKRQSNALVPSPIPLADTSIEDNDKYRSFVRKDVEVMRNELINDALMERSAVSRQHVTDFVTMIQEFSQSKEKQRVRRRSQFSDIVQDVGFFRFVNSDEFELPLPPRKRTLFPEITQRLPTVSQTVMRCSLLLTIVGGKNVPTNPNDNDRKEVGVITDDERRVGYGHVLDDNFNKVVHRGLVVKVTFRGDEYFTKAVNGSMRPFWKETLVLPLIKEGSTVSLSSLRNEMVDISVFDCVDIDLRRKGGFYDDEDARLLDHRFLVSVFAMISQLLSLTLLSHVAFASSLS